MKSSVYCVSVCFKMESLKYFLSLLVLFLHNYVDEADGNCILNIDKDFGNPSPVFLHNGEILAPNSRGEVTVRRAGKLTVGCPGRALVLGNDTTNSDALEASCKSGVTFSVGRWEGSFKDIRCDGPPWTSSEQAGTCHGGINALHRIGFNVQNKFYSLYEVCFDKDLVTTTYVRHKLLPTAVQAQAGSKRPGFIEGTLFGKLKVAQLYKNKQQRNRIVAVLGEGMDDEYMSKKQFLSRGHLAPSADFSLQFTRRASFHYGNVAPQWQRINAGDWAALEDALRRRAASLNGTLEVTTGTLGVLTLPNKQGRDTLLYLADDNNNNGIVPVPMYFFKLAYDPRRKLATAFVTINSSFYNKTTNERLTFCDDVCSEGLKWLTWRNDGAHSFCCSYDQFINRVTYLPPLNVVGDLD